MASNFQLFHYQNRDSLHLHMQGDFDGTSAYELINALKKQIKENLAVFIDTNDINQIHAFGIDVFRNNFNMKVKNKANLIFIGKHKHSFPVKNERL